MVNAFDWRQFSLDERERQGVAPPRGESSSSLSARSTAVVERKRKDDPEYGRVGRISKKELHPVVGKMRRGK